MSYTQKIDEFASTKQWDYETRVALILADIEANRTVFDFGCGTGRMYSIARSMGLKYIGADPLEEAVSVAQDMYPSGVFYNTGDPFDLPHYEADAVVLSHVIAHVPNPDMTMFSMRRVTRPINGKMVIITPNFWNWLVRLPINIVKGYKSDPTAIHSFTMKKLDAMAKANGWEPFISDYIGECSWLGIPMPKFMSSRIIAIYRKKP